LLLSGGELVWLDLDRYRYFSDEENKYVAGSLRIRAFHSPSGLAERYLDAEERLDGVERLRDYVAEARIRHNLHNPLRLRVTCINLVEYMRPALLKGGSTPYIQLLWNGFEVGCTNALPAESRLGTSWFDETFHMLVPYNRLIEDCTLELVAWDSCGKDRRRSALGASKAEAERLRINEEESFLGCRVIHGLELRTLVDSASLFSDSDSEDNDDMSGSQAMVKSVIKWFDLCKSWAVDASRQEPGQIKGRIKVELELIEGDADKKDDDSDDEDDEESDEEQEGSGDDDEREGSESAASSARLSPAARTTKGLVLSPGAADMQSLGSLGSEGRSLRSRRSSKSGRSTRSGRSRQSKDSSPSRRSAVDSRTGKRLDLLASLKLSPAFDLTSLERAYDETGEADEVDWMVQLLKADQDRYWQEQKDQNAVIVPEGATHHFTKHFDATQGRFYYYDHVSGQSTWDKPPGEYPLHVGDAEIDRRREVAETKALVAATAIVNNSRYNEVKAARIQREVEKKARADRAEESRKYVIWQQACLDASSQGFMLNLSWLALGEVHPIVYDFHNNFGCHLRVVRLIGLGLKELPAEFFDALYMLEVLTLTANQLTTLPDTVVKLAHLQELNLLRNKIISLPEHIGLLPSLRSLLIADNQMEKLPITFGALNLLKRVDLSCNRLTVLPENLDNMLSCTTLIVNKNRLVRLPRCISRMPSLTSLSASCNQITYVPEDISNNRTLQILRLGANRINHIVDRIGDMKQLTELSLEYNLIPRLPISFHMLSNLVQLRIDGNLALCDPTAEVLAQGATGVVNYMRRKYAEDQTYLMRTIIVAMQDVLYQIMDKDIADHSMFEPNHKIPGSSDGM
jgi:hypothetical protein